MSITCEIEYTEDAFKDIDDIPNEALQEFVYTIDKLKKNINLGKALSNKNGKDLRDCYKLYFYNAKYRIVYRKKDGGIEVTGIGISKKYIAEVVGIGKRDKEQIYKDVAKRLNRLTGTDDK